MHPAQHPLDFPFRPQPTTGGRTSLAPMGSLKKRRKTKINKHKRKKRLKLNRHKKRLRYKS